MVRALPARPFVDTNPVVDPGALPQRAVFVRSSVLTAEHLSVLVARVEPGRKCLAGCTFGATVTRGANEKRFG